jgi:hypothetical protein
MKPGALGILVAYRQLICHSVKSMYLLIQKYWTWQKRKWRPELLIGAGNWRPYFVR